ncbi:hypothetical protein WS75_07265 [Burkholderia sp. FL-7-2-10-S1-D7]|nr:hypothetical protein WS75_07265 [Burkholderia sp. FL-7-2-10-S1-D7]
MSVVECATCVAMPAASGTIRVCVDAQDVGEKAVFRARLRAPAVRNREGYDARRSPVASRVRSTRLGACSMKRQAACIALRVRS